MKNISITAYQVGNAGKRDVNTSVTFGAKVTDESINRVAGTALNELFAWISVQRAMGASGIALSLPIDLRFQVESEDGEMSTMFDTARPVNPADMSAIKILRQRLKMNNSAKGKRNFAQKFMALFNYATRSIMERDINSLIAEFDELARMEDSIKKAGNEAAKVAASLQVCHN